MKYIELFAGIGSPRQAIKNMGLDWECVGMSEIDKYVIDAYTQLHGPTTNYGDITKIEYLPQADIWFYGFPCQDISISGKNKGLIEGERSNLLWQVLRLIKIHKPKYLIMENVRNLIGPSNIDNFNKYIEALDELGYNSTYKLLNSADFNIPQQRKRVFMVSVLCDEYIWPEKIIGKSPKLKEFLDKHVDFKYYINADFEIDLNKDKVWDNKPIRLGQHGNGGQGQRVYSVNGTSTTLSALGGGWGAKTGLYYIEGKGVRKLTPHEAFRLMGFNTIPTGISDAQLYKMAGNSIVVNVMEYVIRGVINEWN